MRLLPYGRDFFMSKEKKASGMSLDKLGLWIIVATVLGAAVGLIMGKPAHMFAPMGNLFMQLIKMVVVPLVLFSLIGGAASLGKSSSAGKIGVLTFIYYGITTAVSVMIALAFSELFKPGMGIDMAAISGAAIHVEHMEESTQLPGFWETITGFIPENPFKALVDGNILQVISFAMFLGFAATHLDDKKKDFLMDFFNNMTELFIKIMTGIMYVAPIGVFCLMANVVAVNGADIIGKLALIIGVAYIGYIVHVVVVYGLSVKFLAKMSPLAFFKGIAPAMITAFTTTSSNATLPVNIECCNKMGAEPEVSSFVLPLGATINMDGTAIYQAVCAVFIACCYGVQLTLGDMAMIVLTATLASVGTAGVSGAGMIMLAMVLTQVGLPVEGIAIIAGVDKIFDMGRTTLNITGDATCALFISRLEREKAAKKAAKAAK